MKKIIIKISIIAMLLGTNIPQMWSQPPPPSHAQTSNQVADAGAPIGNGTLLLLGMAALYGGRRLYLIKKEEE